MTVLVLAGNALVMFIGWEAWLASYLLIGFCSKEVGGRRGKKAFIVNRIGDFASSSECFCSSATSAR